MCFSLLFFHDHVPLINWPLVLLTFICLGGHQESVSNPRRLEYQTARTTEPYWYQQRSTTNDWSVSNHSHICDNFVASLGEPKERAGVSRCVSNWLTFKQPMLRSVGPDSQHKADRSAVPCSCPELLLQNVFGEHLLFPEGTLSKFWKDQPVGCIWTGPSILLYFISCKNFVRPLCLVCYSGTSVRSAQVSRL